MGMASGSVVEGTTGGLSVEDQAVVAGDIHKKTSGTDSNEESLFVLNAADAHTLS
jgi:hypothetical protein